MRFSQKQHTVHNHLFALLRLLLQFAIQEPQRTWQLKYKYTIYWGLGNWLQTDTTNEPWKLGLWKWLLNWAFSSLTGQLLSLVLVGDWNLHWTPRGLKLTVSIKLQWWWSKGPRYTEKPDLNEDSKLYRKGENFPSLRTGRQQHFTGLHWDVWVQHGIETEEGESRNPSHTHGWSTGTTASLQPSSALN